MRAADVQMDGYPSRPCAKPAKAKPPPVVAHAALNAPVESQDEDWSAFTPPDAGTLCCRIPDGMTVADVLALPSLAPDALRPEALDNPLPDFEAAARAA